MARQPNRRGRGKARRCVPDVAARDLPALSTLCDLPSLERLQASAAQVEAYERAVSRLARSEGVSAEELRLGCVVRLDRGFPAVMTSQGPVRAEFAAGVTKSDNSRAAVGDWVCVRVPEGHEMAMITEVLPREGEVARWRGGPRGERQTLAANVDLVLVVWPLGSDPLPTARLARSAVVARDCGAEVAYVLTKADRTNPDGLCRDLDGLHRMLGNNVGIAVTSSSSDISTEMVRVTEEHGAHWGVEGVRELVPTGTVAIVLGESGAGKSTLLNALLGHDALETGAVRESDDTGRHTTVTRRMVDLPGCGVIVDSPGLRSLPLVGHERGLSLVFPELTEAAQHCRFRDCTHSHEPGCAVREGVDSGDIDASRAKAYLALAAEMRDSRQTLQPDVTI